MESIYDTRLLDYISTPQNSLEYPLNGTIGLNTIQSWWGNTVFTKTGDWNSVSLKTVAPGDTFGCVYSLTLFFFVLLRFTLFRSALSPYRNASAAKVSLTRDPRCGRPFSPLPYYPSWFLLFRRPLFSQYLGRFPFLVNFLPLTFILGVVHNVQRHVLRNTRWSSLSCFFASRDENRN